MPGVDIPTATIRTGLQASTRVVHEHAGIPPVDSENMFCSQVRTTPEKDMLHTDMIVFGKDKGGSDILMSYDGEILCRTLEMDQQLRSERAKRMSGRDRFWKWETVEGKDGEPPCLVDFFEWTCEVAEKHNLTLTDLMVRPMSPIDYNSIDEVVAMSAAWMKFVNTMREYKAHVGVGPKRITRCASAKSLRFAESLVAANAVAANAAH
jgi:hypothetical protein